MNGFPVQYNNLSKPSNVPSVEGGILWPDSVNKLFYLYGGQYSNASPVSFDLWAFDTITGTWNRTLADSSQSNINRAAFGAGVTIEDRAWSYYFGGWLSNDSVPGWAGSPLALNSMLKYDMVANTWANDTYKAMRPSAEGVMLYIPASDAGMLVYFGGLELAPNGTNYTMAAMDEIHIFDIGTETWLMQKAGGEIPQERRRFCAGVVWAEDRSSYNM